MKKLGSAAVSLAVLLTLLVSVFSGCAKGVKSSATTSKNTGSQVTTKQSGVKTSGASASIAKTQQSTKDQSTLSENSNGETSEQTNAENNEEGSGQSNEETGSSISDGKYAGFKFRPEEFDLGGKTVDFRSLVNLAAPANTPEEQKKQLKARKLEAKYNFKFAPANGVNYDNFIASMLSGINYADVFPIHSQKAFPQFVKLGYLRPLDEYLDFENPAMSPGADLTKYLDGKHYSINTGIPTNGLMTLYNQDLLSKQGLTSIQELAKVNRWDWDTLLDYAKTLTLDFNGDGIIDQYGLALFNIISGICYSNDARALTVNENDNTFVSGLFEQKGIKALNFVNDLMCTLNVVDTKTTYYANFLNGLTGIMIGF